MGAAAIIAKVSVEGSLNGLKVKKKLYFVVLRDFTICLHYLLKKICPCEIVQTILKKEDN